MACYQFSPHQLWRTLHYFGKHFSLTQKAYNKSFKIPTAKSFLTYSPSPHFDKDYGRLSCSIKSKFSGIASSNSSSSSDSIKEAVEVQMQRESVVLDSDQNEDKLVSNVDSSNGRVMLIDGTSIIYRAYYRLLAKLHHGHLSHADGNGDWVLTIFTALSLIIDVLEFIPSHVAVIFDHDGVPFGPTSVSSQQNIVSKGLNFRHTLYPLYKSHRPPTPDTIVQGLQYLKASIKAMSIKVIEVPGVEADDVIGTLALRSVDAGFKVRVVSPDKDFFQILSPSLRLLRIAPRGFEMVSYGIEDFAEQYGSLTPSQFVDVVALVGDKSDNIPGVDGIGGVRAVQLITKFGMLPLVYTFLWQRCKQMTLYPLQYLFPGANLTFKFEFYHKFFALARAVIGKSKYETSFWIFTNAFRALMDDKFQYFMLTNCYKCKDVVDWFELISIRHDSGV